MVNQLPPIAEEAIVAHVKIIEHLAYLKQMADDGVVSPGLAQKAKLVWHAAWNSVEDRLPVPAGAAFPNGPIEFHWAIGPYQLSAEISADGPCHWTYRNKITTELWGEETAVDDGLPSRLVEYLTRIAASNRFQSSF